MPFMGFELIISAGERPQTHVLDRAAAGTGQQNIGDKIVRRKWIIPSKSWRISDQYFPLLWHT